MTQVYFISFWIFVQPQKCLDGNVHHVHPSRNLNLMEGHPICSYEYISLLTSTSDFKVWNFAENHAQHSDFHAVFSLSFSTNSNCWSWNKYLIFGLINNPAFTFSKLNLGNFPPKQLCWIIFILGSNKIFHKPFKILCLLKEPKHWSV